MARTICRIPLSWTLADYDNHSCCDGSHIHISHSELAALEQSDIVIHLRRSTTRREKSVVQVQELARRDDRWAGRPSATSAVAGERMNAGLSFRVGELLAQRVRMRQAWAIVMLSEISNRPLREEYVDPATPQEMQPCPLD